MKFLWISPSVQLYLGSWISSTPFLFGERFRTSQTISSYSPEHEGSPRSPEVASPLSSHIGISRCVGLLLLSTSAPVFILVNRCLRLQCLRQQSFIALLYAHRSYRVRRIIFETFLKLGQPFSLIITAITLLSADYHTNGVDKKNKERFWAWLDQSIIDHSPFWVACMSLKTCESLVKEEGSTI